MKEYKDIKKKTETTTSYHEGEKYRKDPELK